QTELAERFGVSRVAIRDALQQLRQRGLVVDVPRKGTLVRPVSIKTVRDLFAVRQAIEGLAARLACARLTEGDFARLERIIAEQERRVQQPDLARLIEADWEFHQTIYARSDNEPLQEMIALFWSRTRQARGLAQSEVNWGREWGKHSAARHRHILAALRARDAAQTERLIVETIALAAEELAQGLQEAGWGNNENSHLG
ncbi:MAG: GntR family transcriptional regulator, partial [Anaerolineales bacterium]|nr:GntR family transcriptional regulator [Anaerolineales bacterium]